MKKSVVVDGRTVEAEVTCTRLWLKLDRKEYELKIKPNNMLMGRRRTHPTWHALTNLTAFPDKQLLAKLIQALLKPEDTIKIGQTLWVVKEE